MLRHCHNACRVQDVELAVDYTTGKATLEGPTRLTDANGTNWPSEINVRGLTWLLR